MESVTSVSHRTIRWPKWWYSSLGNNGRAVRHTMAGKHNSWKHFQVSTTGVTLILGVWCLRYGLGVNSADKLGLDLRTRKMVVFAGCCPRAHASPTTAKSGSRFEHVISTRTTGCPNCCFTDPVSGRKSKGRDKEKSYGAHSCGCIAITDQ